MATEYIEAICAFDVGDRILLLVINCESIYSREMPNLLNFLVAAKVSLSKLEFKTT